MGFSYFGDANTDMNEGKKLLRYFYDKASTYPAFAYKSLEEFLNAYGTEISAMFTESVGRMARLTDLDQDDMIEIMEEIADRGEGKIPNRYIDFSSALADEGEKTSVLDAISYVASGVSEDLSSAAMQLSDTVRATLTVAKYLVPAMLFAGLGFWIYTNAKRFSIPKRK